MHSGAVYSMHRHAADLREKRGRCTTRIGLCFHPGLLGHSSKGGTAEGTPIWRASVAPQQERETGAKPELKKSRWHERVLESHGQQLHCP